LAQAHSKYSVGSTNTRSVSRRQIKGEGFIREPAEELGLELQQPAQ
jgi:hypothetical protein